MSEVARRRAAPVGRPKGGDGDVPGRALDSSAWDGDVLDESAFGATLPELTGPRLAGCVRDEGVVLRRPDGRYYRRRVAWAAYRDGIVVGVAAQPLLRGDDAKLRSSGSFAVESIKTYRAAHEARRRSGDVSVDPDAAGPTSGPDASSTDPLRKRFPTGFSTLAFLPGQVRRGVLRQPGTMTEFIGQIVQYDNGDRYEANLLRMEAASAVVVYATTHQHTTSWAVQQYSYELAPAIAAPTERPELHR